MVGFDWLHESHLGSTFSSPRPNFPIDIQDAPLEPRHLVRQTHLVSGRILHLSSQLHEFLRTLFYPQ